MPPSKKRKDGNNGETTRSLAYCKSDGTRYVVFATPGKKKSGLEASEIHGTCKKDICCTMQTDHDGECTIVRRTIQRDEVEITDVCLMSKHGMEWTFTDGTNLWNRTDPFHTHQGRFNLDRMHGYDAPKIPPFISNAFNMEKAVTMYNVNEGRTGYITVNNSSDLVIGRCKSGRSFLCFKLSDGKNAYFQQRYASYLKPEWEKFWVWNFDSPTLDEVMKGKQMVMTDSKQNAFVQEMQKIAHASVVAK